MELLGVAKSRLVHIAEPTVVPKLWIGPWQSRPAQLAHDCYNWIYDKYTVDSSSEPRHRLYLSRNHVRPGWRSVTNESTVVAYLEARVSERSMDQSRSVRS